MAHIERMDWDRFRSLCGERDQSILDNPDAGSLEDLWRLSTLATYFDAYHVQFELRDRMEDRYSEDLEERGLQISRLDIRRGQCIDEWWIKDFFEEAPDDTARLDIFRYLYRYQRSRGQFIVDLSEL